LLFDVIAIIYDISSYRGLKILGECPSIIPQVGPLYAVTLPFEPKQDPVTVIVTIGGGSNETYYLTVGIPTADTNPNSDKWKKVDCPGDSECSVEFTFGPEQKLKPMEICITTETSKLYCRNDVTSDSSFTSVEIDTPSLQEFKESSCRDFGIHCEDI
jgi:hypothetical protein